MLKIVFPVKLQLRTTPTTEAASIHRESAPLARSSGQLISYWQTPCASFAAPIADDGLYSKSFGLHVRGFSMFIARPLPLRLAQLCRSAMSFRPKFLISLKTKKRRERRREVFNQCVLPVVKKYGSETSRFTVGLINRHSWSSSCGTSYAWSASTRSKPK